MPIPTTTGGEMRLEVNANTGKLRPVWTNGDLAFDDTMTETVMSLLFEDESTFIEGRRPGPGPMSVAADTADAPSAIKARSDERLQFAVDDGRLQSFAVAVSRPASGQRGKFLLSVDYTTRQGKSNNLTFPIG